MTKQIDTVPLGRKLYHFRKRSQMSQMDVEISADLSPGAISRIENGTTNPTKETILKLAEVYSLNNLELEYLIGRIATPANNEEVLRAQEAISPYFKKVTTIAYLLDERGRFFAMSKGMRLLLEISEHDIAKMSGLSMPKLIFDDSFGLKKILTEEKFEETVSQSYIRTFSDIGFMIGDPALEESMYYVKTVPYLQKLWNDFETNGAPIPTETTRTVHVTYKGKNIKMLYSVEELPSNKRFRIFDYKPTNFLLRILQKFV